MKPRTLKRIPNPFVAHNSGRARCLSDVAYGLGFVSYLIRRSRIPARSERGCVAELAKRSIWSVVDFAKKDREDAIPPERT
jgi:hypothetical protein